MEIEVKQLYCKRCGYSWIPRQKDVTLCPKCKSPYWNKPKRVKEKKMDIKEAICKAYCDKCHQTEWLYDVESEDYTLLCANCTEEELKKSSGSAPEVKE